MKSTIKSTSQELYAPATNHFDLNLLNKAFEHMKEGVVFINKDGTLGLVNPAFVRMCGIGKDELFRYEESADYIIYDFNLRRLKVEEWPVRKVIKGQRFENENYIVQPGKGNKVLISCTGIPQLNDKNEFESGILFVQDISEQININRQLENEIFKKNEYVEQLELSRRQLKNERRLLQAIIDSIPVMITIYEENANSIILNNAFIDITGWNNEDAAKDNIMKLSYPDPVYRNEVAEFMQSLKPGFKDIIMRTKDGRDIETSWANVKLPDGRQVGVGIDISGRKQLERDLIVAREKAEKENYIQYAFIQNISHEVRTPMNSILGFTELLQHMVEGEKENEFLDAISHNGRQLLRLIDDIIDFSRLDKNELSLSRQTANLAQVLEQLKLQIPGLKNTYRKRHLTTSVNLPANADEIIIDTDIYRLHQVLINLLSNALKYTDRGSVELGCSVQEKELLFYVRDTGIGIDLKDHDRVFQRFNRFHNTGKNLFQGTGLGLAICKHLVLMLGGEIWFESEPGKGSVFYFTHPVSDPQVLNNNQLHRLKENEKNYKLPNLEGKTILIAEDDHFSYMMLYHMMTETRAKVLHAETGSKAVEIMNTTDVDLVFLDIRMPELNGYQVIKKIREKNAHVPVIAQTANAFLEDRDKIILSGFNYHATKPISQNELFSILNRFLKN